MQMGLLGEYEGMGLFWSFEYEGKNYNEENKINIFAIWEKFDGNLALSSSSDDNDNDGSCGGN
jgi:hypothetical protein